mgnify:CR=1 FL=1
MKYQQKGVLFLLGISMNQVVLRSCQIFQTPTILHGKMDLVPVDDRWRGLVYLHIILVEELVK